MTVSADVATLRVKLFLTGVPGLTTGLLTAVYSVMIVIIYWFSLSLKKNIY